MNTPDTLTLTEHLTDLVADWTDARRAFGEARAAKGGRFADGWTHIDEARLNDATEALAGLWADIGAEIAGLDLPARVKVVEAVGDSNEFRTRDRYDLAQSYGCHAAGDHVYIAGLPARVIGLWVDDLCHRSKVYARLPDGRLVVVDSGDAAIPFRRPRS